jgi:hypothetical protein
MPLASEPTLVRLGYRNKPEVSFADNGQYDKVCSNLAGLQAMLSGFLGGGQAPSPKASSPKASAPKASAPKGEASAPKGVAPMASVPKGGAPIST